MRALRVSVQKSPPRGREKAEWFCGSFDLLIRACAKKFGDPYDSYLHVGTGITRFKVGLREEELRRLLETKDFLKVVHNYQEKIIQGIDFSHIVLTRDFLTIPGSTIKGNVRARIELSLRASAGKTKSCFTRSSMVHQAGRREVWRHRKIWNQTLFEDRGMPCDHTRGGPVCLVCDIFGTAGLKGLVSFGDFVSKQEAIELLGQYGIKLLAAPPGSEFFGRILFNNLKEEELGLLLLGMGIEGSRESRPLLLGRLKYVGKISEKTIGRVRYIINSLRLFQYSQQHTILKPATTIEGKDLDEVVRTLTTKAKALFNFQVVDEVMKLESA